MNTLDKPKFLTLVVKKLNQNSVFKFLSSIRLAVPSMLFLAIIVAIGTLYESKYNAQIAQIIVYKSKWFLALLFLLWINIFCAAVSRIPYKKHHTGFVITHIGLLTLLYGAALTFIYGIDGQLRIVEGQSNNTIMLQELVLKVADRNTGKIEVQPIQRYLNERSGKELDFEDFTLKTGIILQKFIPFSAAEQKFTSSIVADSGSAVEFNLESKFFNVTQTVHSKIQPELSMGPAKIRIVTTQSQKPKPKQVLSHEESLIVLDANTNKMLQTISIKQLKAKKLNINGIEIEFVKTYLGAVVSNGKLIDNNQAGSNPAVELKINQGKNSLREISFEKFPEFNINKNGAFGLKFQYTSNIQPSGESVHANAFDRTQNTIEFQIIPNQTNKVKVELYKENKLIASKTVEKNEPFITPWMGIKITPKNIFENAESTYEIKPVPLVPKLQTPPSAVQIKDARNVNSKPIWLIEGDVQSIQTENSQTDVYYGVETLTLPFSIQLDKFSKVDYPGTSMPMSYESNVKINGKSAPIDIKMNEPLNYEGYTFYQASFEMEPGQPPATILSVNKDPGRNLKYFGAIIMMIGIIIFTLMRSRVYAQLNRPGK